MFAGSAPDSMIEDTNAENCGADQPDCGDSSVWMKSSPYSGCCGSSMRPYICTPHPWQAWRWIVALSSTTFNLSSLAVTLNLSRGTTATTENSAPAGFQHLVQPQTWLWADCASTFTVTGSCVQWQARVPPEKLSEPGL